MMIKQFTSDEKSKKSRIKGINRIMEGFTYEISFMTQEKLKTK